MTRDPKEMTFLSQTGIPSNAYISVRAGSTRRQAAANCGKPFRFPRLDIEDSPVRLDILQSVGTAYLVIKPGEERYQVVFQSDGEQEMACEVEIRPASSEHYEDKHNTMPEKVPSSEEGKTYLEKHRILPFVQAVLQTVMKERPEDPFQHVARHFSCGYDPVDNRSPYVSQRFCGASTVASSVTFTPAAAKVKSSPMAEQLSPPSAKEPLPEKLPPPVLPRVDEPPQAADYSEAHGNDDVGTPKEALRPLQEALDVTLKLHESPALNPDAPRPASPRAPVPADPGHEATGCRMKRTPIRLMPSVATWMAPVRRVPACPVLEKARDATATEAANTTTTETADTSATEASPFRAPNPDGPRPAPSTAPIPAGHEATGCRMKRTPIRLMPSVATWIATVRKVPACPVLERGTDTKATEAANTKNTEAADTRATKASPLRCSQATDTGATGASVKKPPMLMRGCSFGTPFVAAGLGHSIMRVI